jgi:tRNA pseudouridine38-40 synthase
MRNIRLDLAYDGTNYHGWQYQPNALTVQEILQRSVETVVNHKTTIYGASRTDAGVHALHQVAMFGTNSTISTLSLKKGINALLPNDIRVLELSEVSGDFHPRHSSVGKKYKYRFFVGEVFPPFERFYCYHLRGKIDILQMTEAANLFTGTNDFQSFRDSMCSASTSVRTITKSQLLNLNNGCLEYIIEGNGFLHHMVRIITGTLFFVGKGKLSVLDVKKIIQLKDRKYAGPTAPACGLFLEKVYY